MCTPENPQAEPDYELLKVLIKHELLVRKVSLKEAEGSAEFIVKRYREIKTLDSQPERP